VDGFEWNKDQNVRKRVKFNVVTELSVWGAIKGEQESLAIAKMTAQCAPYISY